MHLGQLVCMVVVLAHILYALDFNFFLGPSLPDWNRQPVAVKAFCSVTWLVAGILRTDPAMIPQAHSWACLAISVVIVLILQVSPSASRLGRQLTASTILSLGFWATVPLLAAAAYFFALEVMTKRPPAPPLSFIIHPEMNKALILLGFAMSTFGLHEVKIPPRAQAIMRGLAFAVILVSTIGFVPFLLLALLGRFDLRSDYSIACLSLMIGGVQSVKKWID